MEKNNTGLRERLRRVLRVPTWPCPMSLLLTAEGCQRLTRVDVDLAQLSLQTLANAAACVFHTEHAFTWTATSTPHHDMAQPSPSPTALATHSPHSSASLLPRHRDQPLSRFGALFRALEGWSVTLGSPAWAVASRMTSQ